MIELSKREKLVRNVKHLNDRVDFLHTQADRLRKRRTELDERIHGIDLERTGCVDTLAKAEQELASYDI